MDRTPSEKPRFSFAKFAAISQFTAEVLVCILLGWLADRQFGSTPIGTVAGTIIGLICGLIHLIRTVGR